MKNQESNERFENGTGSIAQKRKWPYSDANTYSYVIDKGSAAKKCAITYDYENYQPNHQFSASAPPTSSSNDQRVLQTTHDTITTNGQNHQSQPLAHNTMELSENIEYVNILYEDNLLTGIQAPVATETNYINFDSNWNNTDILDLDQRNYYYETTTANVDVQQNLNDLNDQLSHEHHHQPTHTYQEYHLQSNQQHQLESQPNQFLDQTQPQHTSSPQQKQMTPVSQSYETVHSIYVDSQSTGENAATLPSVHDDSEDKNLSWLYNYKLNELPHLSPEVNRSRTETGLQVDKLIQEVTASEIEEANQIPNEANSVENPARLPKKPPFTYTELIEYALEDKKELTVSGIYNWISDRFPFYKSNDDRWKNSVRHNLSINPHFRKGNKAPQGAGHLWIISTRDSEANLLAWEHKKQRLELFFKMEKTFGQVSEPTNNDVPPTTQNPQDETSVAVANLASIMECNKSPETNQKPALETADNRSSYQNSAINANGSTDDELKKSAGEILNGVKRTVEVQVINSTNTFNFQDQSILDYLNPVPKDQIVTECGLRSSRNHGEFGNDYFVTEMEPIELGINMNSNSENDEVLFGDEFNLNYFGITTGNNIMA